MKITFKNAEFINSGPDYEIIHTRHPAPIPQEERIVFYGNSIKNGVFFRDRSVIVEIDFSSEQLKNSKIEKMIIEDKRIIEFPINSIIQIDKISITAASNRKTEGMEKNVCLSIGYFHDSPVKLDLGNSYRLFISDESKPMQINCNGQYYKLQSTCLHTCVDNDDIKELANLSKFLIKYFSSEEYNIPLSYLNGLGIFFDHVQMYRPL